RQRSVENHSSKRNFLRRIWAGGQTIAHGRIGGVSCRNEAQTQIICMAASSQGEVYGTGLSGAAEPKPTVGSTNAHRDRAVSGDGDIPSCVTLEGLCSSAPRTELERNTHALEQRVAERTAKLQETIADLKAFSYSVSHDLRAPVGTIQGLAR